MMTSGYLFLQCTVGLLSLLASIIILFFRSSSAYAL